MPKLQLISHDLCPYVQRAVIALAEKGVPFERTDVDLAAKPEWFLRLSPLGKVPLLKVGDEVVFESAVILEYLEETQPRPLYPADPLARARQRAFIEFGSAILSDIWGMEIAQDRDALDVKIAALTGKFARVEAELKQGPWFAGSAVGLVDAAFAPIFRYFESFDAIFDHGILAQKPKTAVWRAALLARPSVRAAVVPDYRARLDRFIRCQNGALAALMTRKAA
jgi:glutathione S-transferase